jgi:hypothetical protein
MLAAAALLILAGLPGKDGVHRKFLRFNAALVLYPPVVLLFVALGTAAIVSELLTK